MRYLLLAVSAAILLTSAACHVHVAGTAPTTRRSPPPAATAHPPLSEVAVIYIDHWGIGEPDYWVLRQEFHLSDDDIGVVLFLADRSPWNWRRVASQRRARHDWQTITRMVGLTPVVYFLDIPRGAHLRHPYQGLYNQYWRYRSRPQRIHLRDPDCVAMARLHLVRERYGYDPIVYMGPGADHRHDAVLKELEAKRRAGTLHATPPPQPLAHEKIHRKDRLHREEVHRGHAPPAESHGATRQARGVGRGAVAHGAKRSPGTKEPPGAAVPRSAETLPRHGIKSTRVKAAPSGRSGAAHVAEHGHGREQEPGRVASHTKTSTKGESRRKVAQPHSRGAVATSNTATDEQSKPMAKGGTRGEQGPKTAAAHHTGKSAHSPPGPAKTVVSERHTPASRPDQGAKNGVSPHRLSSGTAASGVTRPVADTRRAVAKARGGGKNQRGPSGRTVEAEPVPDSASPAASPAGPQQRSAVTKKANRKVGSTASQAAKRQPSRPTTADAAGPATAKTHAPPEKHVAETDDQMAVDTRGPSQDRTHGHTTTQGQRRPSTEEVSDNGDAGATPFADIDADDPELAGRGKAAGGGRSRDKP